MSHAHDIADFAADGTYVKVDPKSRGHITPAFNTALFAFAAFKGMFVFLLLAPASGSPGPFLFSTLVGVVRFGVVALIVPVFLKEFWRRLVSPLGALRPIDYSEALAIVLMAAIIFGG